MLLALPLCLALAAIPLTGAVAQQKKKNPAPPPSIAASIVVDMNSGAVLHAQAADTPRYPASLTKMMTLYVLFGYMKAGKIGPTTEFVVTPHAASQSPTKLGLKAGSKISAADAIKALVTLSANDMAATVAENIAGTEESFAKLMTETARRIGMKSTTFRNASGLPNDEQISTARDMAILSARLIQDYPEYYGVFETRTFAYKGRDYRNHNRLLFGYKGTDGIKTGYTRASGFNLAASVKRDDKHLVAVVLGGNTGAGRDAAMRALLDKNFPTASAKKAPAAKSLIASLFGSSSAASAPQSLPPVKPPVVASGATPAPAAPPIAPAKKPETGTPPVTAASGTKKPAFALAAATPGLVPTVSEGDLGDPSDALAKQSRGKMPRFEGAYHVQVGAFMSQADAESRLGSVQQRASDLLDGHLPFTATFMKDNKEWFRARFAGFSKDDAQATCEALKKRSFECIIMRAE
jgi:D-alanyl-D-alanine carboxypeptidase